MFAISVVKPLLTAYNGLLPTHEYENRQLKQLFFIIYFLSFVRERVAIVMFDISTKQNMP